MLGLIYKCFKCEMKKHIKFRCDYCDIKFICTTQNLKGRLKNTKGIFCSTICASTKARQRIECKCSNCSKIFNKKKGEMTLSGNNFCSQSCAATYTNRHRKHGYRRSKFEQYIEDYLTSININANYNSKIDGLEFDIFIPSMNLAIEVSGIVHYKPIYGEAKFNRIQELDRQKQEIAKINGFQLITIDVSKYSRTEKHKQDILDIVSQVVGESSGIPTQAVILEE